MPTNEILHTLPENWKGEEIRITYNTMPNGAELIHIRLWYVDQESGEKKPSKQGVVIPKQHWHQFFRGIEEANKKMGGWDDCYAFGKNRREKMMTPEQLDQLIKDCRNYPSGIRSSCWGYTQLFLNKSLLDILEELKENPSLMDGGWPSFKKTYREYGTNTAPDDLQVEIDKITKVVNYLGRVSYCYLLADSPEEVADIIESHKKGFLEAYNNTGDYKALTDEQF